MYQSVGKTGRVLAAMWIVVIASIPVVTHSHEGGRTSHYHTKGNSVVPQVPSTRCQAHSHLCLGGVEFYIPISSPSESPSILESNGPIAGTNTLLDSIEPHFARTFWLTIDFLGSIADCTVVGCRTCLFAINDLLPVCPALTGLRSGILQV